jgi:dUTP pyrophosphatase
MRKTRGFEIVSKYKNEKLFLPERATKGSAGYDLAAAADTVIPSLWKILSQKGEVREENKNYLKSILVPTGIKAYMPEDEYLMLVNRSSNPLKNNLSLPNGIGIIDSDYYNNGNNEGEIFVQLINYGIEDYTIEKGDRIAQGIFTPYGTVDDEVNDFGPRTGGFGSSGRN